MADVTVYAPGITVTVIDAPPPTTPPPVGDTMYVDVRRDCAAVGDGVADDTTKLQAAVTQAIANHRPIYVPPGIYRVTQTIDFGMAQFVEVSGAGSGYPLGGGGYLTGNSIIKVDGPIYGFTFGGATVNHKGPHVAGIGFQASEAHETTALGGIHVTNTNRGRFERLAFGQFVSGTGMLLDGSGVCVEHILYGLQVRNCRSGVLAPFATALTILGGSFVGSSAKVPGSVGLRTSETARVLGAAFDGWDIAVEITGDSNEIAARLENNNTGVKIVSGRRNHISGCMFNQMTTGVVLAAHAQQFGNVVAYNNWADVVTPVVNQTLAGYHSTIHEPMIGLMDLTYGASGVAVKQILRNARQANNEGAFFEAQSQRGAQIAKYGADSTGTAAGALFGSTTNDRAHVLTNNTVVASFERSSAITSGGTALLLMRDVGGVKTMQPVTMGAPDSGGVGFRILRVVN